MRRPRAPMLRPLRRWMVCGAASVVAVTCTVVAGTTPTALAQQAPHPSTVAPTTAEPDPQREANRTPRPDRRTDLRGVLVAPDSGLDSTYVCGDLRLTARVALTGCGTGAGALHAGDQRFQAVELAHIRADWTALELPLVDVLFGVGIAEAQLGPDETGLVFSPTADASSPEAAGVEAAVGLDLPAGVTTADLRIRLDAGAAWIPGLPTIGGPGPLVPFAVVTANGRF